MPDAQSAARGEKVYAPTCAFCHGEKARGAAGPNLVRSELVLHDEKGELIGPAVSKGRVDKGMPAFAAFTDPVGNLIAYDPATGEILWHFRVGAQVSNGPSTYVLNGIQYLIAGAGDTPFAFKIVK